MATELLRVRVRQRWSLSMGFVAVVICGFFGMSVSATTGSVPVLTPVEAVGTTKAVSAVEKLSPGESALMSLSIAPNEPVITNPDGQVMLSVVVANNTKANFA